MSNKTQELSGIGGWLVLPAIGLVLSPILYAVTIVRSFVSGFGYNVFENVLFGILLLIKVGLFVFICILAYSFFKKSKATPHLFARYMQALLGVSCIYFLHGVFIQYWKYGLVHSYAGPLLSSNLIGIAIACAIWIPYFRRSRRVAATFLR